MVRSFGSKTSRVFDLDAKSLQLLVARSGKAITDAEGILIQDLQALKLSQFTNTLTFSGCVDLPPFRLPDPDVDTSITSNFLIIPPFRALVNNDLIYVQGTKNPLAPLSLDNYVELPPAPSASYGIVVIYLEAWYQVLEEQASNLNQGFYPNNSPTFNPSTDARYFFPYGNTLAHVNWITQPKFADDLVDPLAGVTSGRVQLQYALRATQVIPQQGVTPEETLSLSFTPHLKNFGLTHPGVLGWTFVSPDPSKNPGFVFAGDKDPGLYTCSSNQLCNLRTVDGNTYAIPLAIMYQRNSGIWSPVGNPHGTDIIGIDHAGAVASGKSGRPDGLFYDKPSPDDFVDTRSTFLGGSLEDYASVIKQASCRLWEGSLRLKLAEPPVSDTNAHQLGQTLLSQELLGTTITSPLVLSDSLARISANSEPHTSWTSDRSPDTITYMVSPSMKDLLSSGVPSSNLLTWDSGDRVTITYPNTTAVIETVTIYTFNQQAQILRVPPSYISVDGLGSNQLQLNFLDIGVDLRFNLSKPIWVVVAVRSANSFEHLRYVPQTVHTPLYSHGGSLLPCGAVSDYSMVPHDSVVPGTTLKLRSYKRNYDPNAFGTVRLVKVPLSTLHIPASGIGPVAAGVHPVIGFSASSQPVSTPAITLSWGIENATRATLKNVTTGLPIGEVPTTGSINIQILQTTDFLLTAYNGDLESSTTLTVTPSSETSGGSSLSGQTVYTSYVAPGGPLNPENIQTPYSIAYLNLAPGFGDPLKHVMVGCLKATLFQTNSLGETLTTDLQIRHQYFNNETSNTSLTNAEIGVFGQWGSFDLGYIEFEILVVGEKTFHYNPTVQGITSVTSIVAPSQNGYLFFSDPASSDSQNYSFQSYPEYALSALNIVVSAPANDWTHTQTILNDDGTTSQTTVTQKLSGVFEGVFGFGGQSFVFVKLVDNPFYRTVPCNVQGLGTPLLHINIPQITLLQVEDVLVLAQTTSLLTPDSTTLLSYTYVPYQGEGDAEDTYTLTYLNDQAQVTTFGTGTQVIPGLLSTSSVNPMFPIASSLPAVTGWKDSDLTSSKFEVSGSYSGLGNPVYSTTDFLQTTPVASMSGNLKHLLNISSDNTPALSPRSEGLRGFTKNIVSFAYVIDEPQVVPSYRQLDLSTSKDLVYWVDVLTGDDSNSGLTREAPRKSIQSLINSLPAVIHNAITINVNGLTTISTDVIPSINLSSVTPYGSPRSGHVYSLLHTSFNTQGDGVVIIQKDPTTNTSASIVIPEGTPFVDYPIYGWLHTNGNLVIKGFSNTSVDSIILAAYPGTTVSIEECAFDGGEIQILSYGANVSVASSSLSNPTKHAILATSGGSVTLGEKMVVNKSSSLWDGTHYEFFVAEKNSSIIFTQQFSAQSFPTYSSSEQPGTFQEFLVKQYSVLDTSAIPGFSFYYNRETVKLLSFSNLIYKGLPWFAPSETSGVLPSDGTTLYSRIT